MEIITTNFEKPYILNIEGKTVVLTFFKTEEHGNVKIGVDAPRGLAINREEIFLQKKRSINYNNTHCLIESTVS